MITIYQYFNVGIKYFVPKSEQNSDQKVRGATGSMALRIKSWPAAKTVGDLEEAAELINRRVMSWSGTRRSMRSSMPAAPADNLCLKAKKWTVNSLSLAKNTSAHNGSFSARMVESNAGHPSVCISVRSTAFQRSSGCRRRERQAHRSRSSGVNFGFFTERRRTPSWCRSATFSNWRAARVLKTDDRATNSVVSISSVRARRLWSLRKPHLLRSFQIYGRHS